MKSRLIIIAIAVLCIFSVQAEEPFVVKDIRIEGLQKISEGALLNYLPINIGDTLDEIKIKESIRAVYTSGFFKNIEFRKDPSEDILIISVLERPSIGNISIDGNKDIKTEDLEESLNKIGFRIGRTYDPSVLDEIERSLIDQYFSFGKYSVQIETNVEDLPGNTVRISIDVKEGDRAQIRQINIVGNNVFNDEDLLDQLTLQMPDWLSFIRQDDRYSREDLQGDLETIESFYLDRGYANFSINSAQVAISPDRTGIFVTVNISEGDVYKLSDVKLTGEFVVPKEEIQRLVLAQPGQIFSQGLLTQATELIKYRLGEDGYSFAEVQAIPELDDENKKVKVVFYIQPKNRVYVRRVSFSDTTSINDDVLRRELRQMEGGYMSKSRLERSKIRLQRLPFIEEVEFDTIPVAGTTDLVDAEFTIKEGLPGQFGGGVGYSGYQKLILNGNFVHTNFFGTGNRIALDLNSSRYRDLYSFSHTDAYTGLDEIARTTRFSYSSFNQFTASSSDFSTKTFSLGLEYSYPLSEYQRVIIGSNLMSSEMLAGDYSAAQALQWVNSNGDSSCFEGGFTFCKTKFKVAEALIGWVYDSRNRFLFADQGMTQRLMASVAIPGSEVEYYGFNYSYKQYFNIPFPFVNYLTLMAKADIAYNGSYGDSVGVPPYKNFFGGGPDTVRGFKEHRLGPRDNFGNPYGGNLLLTAQFEVILPLPEDWASRARFSLFFDVGNVFSTGDDLDFFDKVGNPIEYSFDVGNLKQSAGLAAQWLAPLGLFRFSYALPLNNDPVTNVLWGDETERFQFTIGGAF